jgi:hypothetical protein
MEEDLQPNVDGLSFDEVLLIGLVPGIVTVLVTGYLTGRNKRRLVVTSQSREGLKAREPIH